MEEQQKEIKRKRRYKLRKHQNSEKRMSLDELPLTQRKKYFVSWKCQLKILITNHI